MALKKNMEMDESTEGKIKSAARRVFHSKGFAATRTRDIAEEAGINLALLNYYFRSKEKLFEIIMLETLQSFILSISHVFNDNKSTLQEKVKTISSNYIDLMLEEPEIPLFIISEIRRDPNTLFRKLPIGEVVLQSVLIQQYKAAVKKAGGKELNPLHFIINLIGMTIFPFIAKPIIQQLGKAEEQHFRALIQERKEMIPLWIESILKTK